MIAGAMSTSNKSAESLPAPSLKQRKTMLIHSLFEHTSYMTGSQPSYPTPYSLMHIVQGHISLLYYIEFNYFILNKYNETLGERK